MCNKISAWQVIRWNFTSNIVLYRLTLIILDTRTFNSHGPSYIESTSSRRRPDAIDQQWKLHLRSWVCRMETIRPTRMFQKLHEYDGNLVASRKSVTLPDKREKFPPFLKGTPSSSKKCQTEGHMLVSLVGWFFDPRAHTNQQLAGTSVWRMWNFSVAHVVGISPPHVLILKGLGTHVPRSWFITPVTKTIHCFLWYD